MNFRRCFKIIANLANFDESGKPGKEGGKNIFPIFKIRPINSYLFLPGHNFTNPTLFLIKRGSEIVRENLK